MVVAITVFVWRLEAAHERLDRRRQEEVILARLGDSLSVRQYVVLLGETGNRNLSGAELAQLDASIEDRYTDLDDLNDPEFAAKVRSAVDGLRAQEISSSNTDRVRTAIALEASVDTIYKQIDADIVEGKRNLQLWKAGLAMWIGLLLAIIAIRYRSERKTSSQLSDETNADSLTGLANRRKFDRRTAGRVDAAHVGVALAVFDIDHFKTINDTLGHPTGDRVIVEVARRLGRFASSDDLLARIGGEEFAWIIQGSSLTDATQAAESACDAIRRMPMYGIDVTISAGVATANHGESYKDLYERADSALLAAKSAGRNQVIAYADAT
jgi:diguanylate cyclase (GGDEF)-like protein